MSLNKYKSGIVVCLTCLNHGCGRYEKKHALAHYDYYIDHDLTINLQNLSIWCYECDNELMDIADKCNDEQIK